MSMTIGQLKKMIADIRDDCILYTEDGKDIVNYVEVAFTEMDNLCCIDFEVI